MLIRTIAVELAQYAITVSDVCPGAVDTPMDEKLEDNPSKYHALYRPTHGFGLLGGIWVGVTFWYALAARNNTVPGQFAEWLHGETLANQGMMLSPWFPPRYLWAAIEGTAGLDLSGGTPSVYPRLSPTWKWLGVCGVPYRGHDLSWFAVRAPELRMYANRQLDKSMMR